MFTPEERRIYGPCRFPGQEVVYFDPSAVYRRLVAQTGGGLNDLLAQYQQDDVGSVAAAERLASAAVIAFDMPAFDSSTGKGMTQDEALGVLSNFLDWRDQKKTPPVNSPTSAPPTVQGGWHVSNSTPRQDFEAVQKMAYEQVGRRPPSPTRRTTPSN